MVRFISLLVLFILAMLFRLTEWHPLMTAYWVASFGMFAAFIAAALRDRTWAAAACWTVAAVGGTLNATVSITNGGMPVADSCLEGMGGPLGPWWKPASECSHFLWLGDNYWGTSIGDFIVLVAVAIALIQLGIVLRNWK